MSRTVNFVEKGATSTPEQKKDDTHDSQNAGKKDKKEKKDKTAKSEEATRKSSREGDTVRRSGSFKTFTSYISHGFSNPGRASDPRYTNHTAPTREPSQVLSHPSPTNHASENTDASSSSESASPETSKSRQDEKELHSASSKDASVQSTPPQTHTSQATPTLLLNNLATDATTNNSSTTTTPKGSDEDGESIKELDSSRVEDTSSACSDRESAVSGREDLTVSFATVAVGDGGDKANSMALPLNSVARRKQGKIGKTHSPRPMPGRSPSRGSSLSPQVAKTVQSSPTSLTASSSVEGSKYGSIPQKQSRKSVSTRETKSLDFEKENGKDSSTEGKENKASTGRISPRGGSSISGLIRDKDKDKKNKRSSLAVQRHDSKEKDKDNEYASVRASFFERTSSKELLKKEIKEMKARELLQSQSAQASQARTTRAKSALLSPVTPPRKDGDGSTLKASPSGSSSNSAPASPLPATANQQTATNSPSDNAIDRPPILSGSLDELVSFLADEGIPDWKYIEEFLIVYRYFISPKDLLAKITQRYDNAAPEDASDELKEQFKYWQGAIRLRVINIIRKWLKDHFYDFQKKETLDRLIDFIENTLEAQDPKWANSLRLSIQQQVDVPVLEKLGANSNLEVILTALKKSELPQQKTTSTKTHAKAFIASDLVDWLTSNIHLSSNAQALTIAENLIKEKHIKCTSTSPATFGSDMTLIYRLVRNPLDPPEIEIPKPFYSPRGETNFYMLHSLEVARQLTLIDFSNFQQIQPSEIKSQVWNKANAAELSKNVWTLTQRFNKTSYWVATEIVLLGALRRAKVIKQFIKVALQLKEMRNYNTLLGIMAGLNLAAISRLKESWKEIPSKYVDAFESLNEFCNPINNYKYLREAQQHLEAPALPYIGLALHDLTFIEDGNPDYLDEGKNVINFEKMRMIATVFLKIRKYQKTQYHFAPVPELQAYLTKSLIIQTEEELYKLSLACEPRTAPKSSGKSPGLVKSHTMREINRDLPTSPTASPAKESKSFIKPSSNSTGHLQTAPSDDLTRSLQLDLTQRPKASSRRTNEPMATSGLHASRSEEDILSPRSASVLTQKESASVKPSSSSNALSDDLKRLKDSIKKKETGKKETSEG